MELPGLADLALGEDFDLGHNEARVKDSRVPVSVRPVGRTAELAENAEKTCKCASSDSL